MKKINKKSAINIRMANLSDSHHFAKLTNKFWNISYSKILGEYQNNMPLFIKGYCLAELNTKTIGSAEGYPIKSIKPISFLSKNNGPIGLFDLSGKYYYIHIIQVLPKFQNQGIGDLLFKTQLYIALENNTQYICGMASKEKISHWIKYGFEEYGELQAYKNFGMFKWIKMEIK